MPRGVSQRTLVMMKVNTFDGSHPDGRDETRVYVIGLGGHSHKLPANTLLSRRRRRRTDALSVPGHGYTTSGWSFLFLSSLCCTTTTTATSARDRKSTRLNSSHVVTSRMPSSA